MVAAAYVDALLEGVALHRPLYIPPYIPLKSARLARQRTAVDCTRALPELGLPLSSIVGALENAARWFRDHSYA